jgi:hypothetical protein
MELEFMRYELTDCEWFAIKPLLPNKPRGVPRVDDRRVLNSIQAKQPAGGLHQRRQLRGQ